MSEPESRKVLLVDDSDLTLSVVEDALSTAGFRVRTARTLADVEAMLLEWTPDVVVTDILMPGVSGTDLCRWFKKRLDPVLVVLMSNLPSETLEDLATRSGADGFVSKGGGLTHLSRRVEELCEGVVW